MGLFSRHPAGVDMRDRDYLLTGCPLVAQDDRIVLVDVTVRLAVRDDRDVVLGYDATEEPTVHAICVLLLRQLSNDVPADELLTGRGLVTDALEQGLALAPVGSGVHARVSHVEVRRHSPTQDVMRHEFRVASH